MEKIDIFKKFEKNVVKITSLGVSTQTPPSGTGFLFLDLLITNNHVFSALTDAVRISQSTHLPEPRHTDTTAGKLRSCFVGGSDEDNHDYAIFDTRKKFADWSLPRLTFGGTESIRIGDPVAVMGFPFGKDHISMHCGHISAVYKKRTVKVIEVDASINNGNSGGPLIHLNSGKIIGIVTRKLTGLSDQFKELRCTLDQNIEMINNAGSGGKVYFSGIDPLAAISATQEQMKITLAEIERSANVAIGIAFDIHDLSTDIEDILESTSVENSS